MKLVDRRGVGWAQPWVADNPTVRITILTGERIVV